MGQLHPRISGQRRLSTSTEDEQAHGRSLWPESLDGFVASSLGGMQGIAKSRQTLQTLHGETIPDVVRAQLVKNAADRERVGQQLSRLSHAPVIIDSFELTGIHKGVPVGHVDHGIIHLRAGVVELVEVAARMEVMVIFVDLSQSVADLKMLLVVVHPMLLAAVYRDATVGALEINMLRGLGARLGIDLAAGLRELSWAVAVVRAAGVLFYEGRALADLGNGRVGERVEEVVLLENRL